MQASKAADSVAQAAALEVTAHPDRASKQIVGAFFVSVLAGMVALSAGIFSMKSELGDLRTEIAVLRTELTTMREALDKLPHPETVNGIKRLEETAKDHEKRLDALEKGK